MSRVARVVLVLGFLLALLPTSASAQALPANCSVSPSPTGALWLVCAPTVAPNGDLVVFAHGYVAPDAPLSAGFDQLTVDGLFIPAVVNSMGFYFAASSYPQNGLAVREGLADTVALVTYLKGTVDLNHVYLVGASEGGLVTALGVEGFPGTFSGGLATCGPIGDFRAQTDYFGDFRVIFDYFFPRVLPGSPVGVPNSLTANLSAYDARIVQAMAADPSASSQLLNVTGAAFDPARPQTVVETALGVLWYNFVSTNQAREELGGQPYGNRTRVYSGSLDDSLLNRLVQRFTASPTALRNIAAYYQTSGRLQRPLVTMHTTGDPIVPYWHEALYAAKISDPVSAAMHVNIPVARYGHCAFTAGETIGAFGVLYSMVNQQPLPLSSVQAALPNAASRAQYSAFVQRVRALK